MRLSRYFLPVLKETPAEAQIVSHRYMLCVFMLQLLAYLCISGAVDADTAVGGPVEGIRAF